MTQWLAFLLAFALLFGCANSGSYVKDHYPLVDVQGKGKDVAKVYAAEGRNVPEVAKELAKEEKPKETSMESQDKMFLVYDDKIINVQKDPEKENNTLIEVDTITYAKQHYDSSFLQGYLTATLLQSMFGGGWFSNRSQTSDYRGYTSLPRTYTSPSGTKTASPPKDTPSTSDRSGSFSSKGSAGSTGTGSTSSTNPNSGSSTGSGTNSSTKNSGTAPTTGGSGSFSSGSTSNPSTGSSSSSSSSVRKNDGSTPSYKSSTGSSSNSKPSTSSRSGSFSSKKK